MNYFLLFYFINFLLKVIKIKKHTIKCVDIKMALPNGLEPLTLRLTAACSTD